MELEKAYDRVNREALWKVMRMHDVGSKLFNNFRSMYVHGLACVTGKGSESDCFRIDSVVRQVCIMSLGSLMYIWTQ